MNKQDKNHDTGLRILETLKILLEEDVTRNELIEKLKNNKQVGGVYTQEAFLKYFNTFEHLGLKLKKDKVKYGLQNALLRINLTKEEQNSLLKLISSVDKLNNRKSEEIIRKMFLRLDKYVDADLKTAVDKTVEAERELIHKNIKENIITSFKNMLDDNQKVSITYKKGNNTEETIVVELKEITEQKSNVYILCYSNAIGRNKKINVDSIISFKQMPGRVLGVTDKKTVVFQIYGGLASAYKIRPNETLLDFGVNYQTVSNVGDDEDMLLRRLLKYGENCKIIKPVYMQKKLLALTDDILKNLEENECQE